MYQKHAKIDRAADPPLRERARGARPRAGAANLYSLGRSCCCSVLCLTVVQHVCVCVYIYLYIYIYICESCIYALQHYI